MKARGGGPERGEGLWYHGGNLGAAMRLFPAAPTPWIDLSTGINPVPFPVGILPEQVWTRLPEPSDVEALESAARLAYGAPSSAHLVAAPGTQALIQWLPRLFPARRVGILDDTYNEHANCWRQAGASVAIVTALDHLASFDVGVVVNPNNPDGRIADPVALIELARTLGRRGARLIVDEAFMDFEPPSRSLMPRQPAAGTIVLRSFGKAYGLAGLRLGFASGSAEDCARLRGALGPWAVSGPAIEIGRRALGDEAWRARTAMRLSDHAVRLDAVLRCAGFDIVGGTTLFRLGCHAEAGSVFDRLCGAGILTRPFRDRPNLLRFGIPHGPRVWDRLTEALRPESPQTGAAR
jgi:cobalamin biosynthesis protein CobC